MKQVITPSPVACPWSGLFERLLGYYRRSYHFHATFLQFFPPLATIAKTISLVKRISQSSTVKAGTHAVQVFFTFQKYF